MSKKELSIQRKPYLIPGIILDAIRDSVENDDLASAASLLSELLEKYNPSKNNDASILRCGISRVEKHERMGTLDYEKISQERNRLGIAILDLALSLSGIAKY